MKELESSHARNVQAECYGEERLTAITAGIEGRRPDFRQPLPFLALSSSNSMVM